MKQEVVEVLAKKSYLISIIVTVLCGGCAVVYFKEGAIWSLMAMLGCVIISVMDLVPPYKIYLTANDEIVAFKKRIPIENVEKVEAGSYGRISPHTQNEHARGMLVIKSTDGCKITMLSAKSAVAARFRIEDIVEEVQKKHKLK